MGLDILQLASEVVSICYIRLYDPFMCITDIKCRRAVNHQQVEVYTCCVPAWRVEFIL